ncbi:hypothetical protein RclHR1_02790007 [Rhizophagus clarus]|uniref:Kinase-like domain-containing protein n=1 Tax=Rhizophagus clarus TaxID=94130 RepID=A0A2Z6RF04_9GLOM|nr:hypothetical protein RclHR1_02790007 [Rhizophagus clarus]GES73326.1 kinase-like domain-containing protein [Rhizophagus clarus]
MSDEYTVWIEEAISKMHIKYFDHQHFRNIEEIGCGGFGNIYRANWKNSEQHLALKSLLKLNVVVAKELVHELKLHREVDFHDNVIRFYGITKDDESNKYMLVMEYAEGGTLKNYLTNNFYNLSWKVKYNLSFQLASAVLCLHDEGIVHCDLHCGNVLIRQDTLKLADFGLSKRIDNASNSPLKLFGVIPYIDPEKFGALNNQEYKLNEKSDVYSVGVLLWVISSGLHPFINKKYDINLAIQISKGLRETPITHTPDEFVNIYTECWKGNSNKRPTMQQVVAKLKAIMTRTNVASEFSPMGSLTESVIATTSIASSINNSLHGELSKLIENFDNMELETDDNNSSITSNVNAESESDVNHSSISSNISTIQKVIKILSSVNDADNVINISVPFPPQITAEEILDRNKPKERKKAPNQFMIYRMAYAKEIKTLNISNINSFNISVLAASKWASEPDEVKRAYKDISNKVQSELEVVRRNSVDNNTTNTVVS